MTAAEMAAIYAAAFPEGRAWSEAEIADLLSADHITPVVSAHGFALLQILPPEAEILTIAIRPEVQGQGHGTALLAKGVTEATERGAKQVFLEVDAQNTAARALYDKAGFAQSGLRKGYYSHADGTRSDALILSRPLSAAKTGDHAGA